LFYDKMIENYGGKMRIKKAIIVGLMLPLVSEVLAIPAHSASVVGTPTPRPTTAARMPSLRTISGVVSAASTTTTNAGLVATCESGGLPERLNSQRCITRYDSCLRGENVCGENFELCYNLKQFNKARIMCQDYLAQCPADAIKALFGNSVTTSDDFSAANRMMCDGESVLVRRTFSPALQDIAVAGDSRIDIAIKEGKNWAAANSVKTCNAEADKCIRTACQNSPQKCISVGGFSDIDATEMVNIITSGETNLRMNASMLYTWMTNMAWDDSNVKNYLKEQCRDTIGANEWCFMVTNGKPAKESDLVDSFNIDEVYQDIMYSGVGARFKMNQAKIKEWAAGATKSSLEECKLALTNCAINACGEGSKPRCYGLAKEGNTVSIKNRAGADIEGQCKNLIENNQYCKDVFLDKNTGVAGDVWRAVWTDDAMGAIVGLDTELQTLYNEQAVAEMRTSCQAQTEKCVINECGDDFSRCFVSSVNVGNFQNKSIVGGVVSGKAFSGGFDMAMARDLCILDVKKIADCNDYFDVQYAKQSTGASADSWGTSSNTRNAWLGAASASEDTTCRPSRTYMTLVDEFGNSTDPTLRVSAAIRNCAAQERSIFEGLLSDIGRRAQSVLERKANDAKDACEAKGVSGRYTWANLAVLSGWNGAAYTKKSASTSALFGGFCEAEIPITFTDISVQYDDKEIMVEMSKLSSCNKSVYKPVGSTYECGEGISDFCYASIDQKIEEASKVCTTRGQTGCLDVLTWGQKNPGVSGLLAGLGGGALGALGGLMAGNAIGNSQTKMGADEQAELSSCNACIAAGGNGYSTTTACAPGTTGTDDEKANALARCNQRKLAIESEFADGKNGLFDIKGSAGGIAGMSVGAVVLGLTAGLPTGLSLANKADKKAIEANDTATAAWIKNKQQIIKCRNNGREYVFGQEFIVE
jgi:hypothetical protein